MVSGLNSEYVEMVEQDRADIIIDDERPGCAFASSQPSEQRRHDHPRLSINISKEIIMGNSPLATFLHEIGHALGLAPPGQLRRPHLRL